MNALHALRAPDPGDLAIDNPCLFLDVDGTLVDLQPSPGDVHVDDELLVLLSRLNVRLGGALALVSGRSLLDLTRMFAPLNVPMAGIHGFERRSANGIVHRPTLAPGQLDVARERLLRLVEGNPGLLLEDKGAAIALHFRLAPALASTAAGAMLGCVNDLGPGFELIEGNCVVEIKPAMQSKGTAIEAFMRDEPFASRVPVYVGDDRTDFDGFAAVRRHQGMDISVGELVAARWRLQDPAAVRAWLQRFAAGCAA